MGRGRKPDPLQKQLSEEARAGPRTRERAQPRGKKSIYRKTPGKTAVL